MAPSRRYFFHAPDGRVYGPVPAGTLRRWRDEGRLRADSRLRAEGEDAAFLTLEEAERREAALPPEPPAPAAAVEEPPRTPAPDPEAGPLPPPQPLGRLIADAARTAGRTWRPLWPALLLMQAPTLVLSVLERTYFHIALDPKTGMASWDHSGPLFGVMAGLVAWAFLCQAFLSLALRDAREGREPSTVRAWRGFAPRIGGLLWTVFLAGCVLLAWGALTALLLATSMAPTLHKVLRAVVLLTAILSAVPTCLLALRCLILPQAAALEGRRGLGALRRAIEVIRLSSRNTLFSDGDLRLFALAMLGAFLGLFVLPAALVLLAKGLALLPLPGRLLLALLELGNIAGQTALIVFMTSLFVHFFEETRGRLRDAGVDSAV